MVCKNICLHHKALRGPGGNGSPPFYRYASGHKHCGTCDLFLIWEGYHCPCCGMKLRTRPRNRYRNKKRGDYE